MRRHEGMVTTTNKRADQRTGRQKRPGQPRRNSGIQTGKRSHFGEYGQMCLVEDAVHRVNGRNGHPSSRRVRRR